jgi:hypothetical protein
MRQPPATTPKQVGATVPDLILRVFASPFLVIPIFLILIGLITAIALGFIEISWGESGLKLAQGQHYSQSSDVSIAGTWSGVAKDLDANDANLKHQYTYRVSMTFTQKGADILMHGSYFVNEDASLPQRILSGKGVIHGDYLSMLYDIQVEQPALSKTHGTLMFRIAPASNTATGYYVARGMANDRFVFGSKDLKR